MCKAAQDAVLEVKATEGEQSESPRPLSAVI